MVEFLRFIPPKAAAQQAESMSALIILIRSASQNASCPKRLASTSASRIWGAADRMFLGRSLDSSAANLQDCCVQSRRRPQFRSL
jgi:hypothetical protein